MLRVGLLVNPIAGIGGAVALKGSDGLAVQREARARGGTPRSQDRTARALQSAGEAIAGVHWLTWDGEMGADSLQRLNIDCEVLGAPNTGFCSRIDTLHAAEQLLSAGIDLLVFAGGDGTARDLLEAIGDSVPVIGIPAGVKMHSGVFATTPESAGQMLSRLFNGELVNAVHRDVKDLDEEALRKGVVRPRYYGELLVPELGGYLQHTKERGRENESLAVNEIVADVVERLASEQRPVVLGPGSTLFEIKIALGLNATLLGFDVWQSGLQSGRDVDSAWLLENVEAAVIVLSFTRAQGFLIGRGNQQLSPEFLRRAGREALLVVGTRTKLASLNGRPLLIDTDDPALDRAFCGLLEITAGYEDRLFHRVETSA